MPVTVQRFEKSVIFHYYYNLSLRWSIVIKILRTRPAHGMCLLDKNIFFDYLNEFHEYLWQHSSQVVHKYTYNNMIDVRFNNLLLFNLVFSLPLGDEIEPVQRDVSVIIYIRFPFYDTSQIRCNSNGCKNTRGEQRVCGFRICNSSVRSSLCYLCTFKRKTAMKWC